MTFTTTSLDFSILPYTEGITPPVNTPNPQFLNDIGEKGMRDLLDRFYILLHESAIKDIFPPSKEAMKIAGQYSADFFIQICAGPAYFNKSRGVPKMRQRHAPFRITPNARLHWLVAFEEALAPIIQEKLSSQENIQSFWNYLNGFSQWMINSRD